MEKKKIFGIFNQEVAVIMLKLIAEGYNYILMYVCTVL